MGTIGRILFALIGAAAAAFGVAAAQPRAPVRVMSLNLCTDQLTLMLLPPERITSVTWMARDPSGSVMVEAARQVGVNYGQAEEVLRDRPDLVVADTFSTPGLRGMLARLGYALIEVPQARNFDEIRAATRQIGAAVGERARAEALIAAMDADLARLRLSEGAWRPRVIAWDGGGAVEGAQTLFHAIIEAAGGRNAAAERGAGFVSYDIEALIAARPDILIESDARVLRPDLRTDAARHPFTRRYYSDRRIAAPQPLYSCGTPLSARAAVALREQFDRIERTVGRAPAYRLGRTP